MNNFSRKNDELGNNESVQITDLDPLQPPQKKRVEKMMASLSQGLTKPGIRYSLMSILLFILFSLVFAPFAWSNLQAHKSTSAQILPGRTFIATDVSPTPVPLALLTLQQRSLHIPTLSPGSVCPTTPERKVTANFGIVQGGGPAFPTIGTDTIQSPAILHYTDAQHFAQGIDTQGWGGQKVSWFVDSHYRGFILVRGRQLDGSHTLRFTTSESSRLMQQFVINTTTTIEDNGWESFGTYTRLQEPGCYAYQVDGNGFSYIIIFQAVVQT